MVEVEIYAAGVRAPEKMMALALELDTLPGIRYKVDTNHDIVYMEFGGDAPSLSSLVALFTKAGLNAKFVGALPPEVSANKKKTQRLTV
ncbi:MAG TPA: hypothetical protein VNB29_08125 [Chthoniobacterales bacterium]|jgi:hypothetical protein|nr:hypothetical protein [Chthoniobacterales bacterium]